MAAARRIIHGSTQDLQDVSSFLPALEPSGTERPGESALFPLGRDVFVTRAPGRLVLLGGPAEAGIRSVEWPLGDGILVALQRHRDRQLRIVCEPHQADGRPITFEMPLHFLEANGHPIAEGTAREYFGRHDDRRWAAPLAAVLLAVMRLRDVRFGEGVRVLIRPGLPLGASLAASAAAIVALLRAVAAEANLPLQPRDVEALVQPVQRVAPFCAPRDHVTPAGATAGAFTVSDVRGAGGARTVACPDGLRVWGLVPAPSERDAADASRTGAVVRTAFARARQQMADQAGLAPVTARSRGQGEAHGDWSTFLASLTTARFAAEFEPRLPQSVGPSEAGEAAHAIPHPAETVDTANQYPVRAAARFIVEEHARAGELSEMLRASRDDAEIEDAAPLLSASERALEALGYVSSACRAIANEANAAPGRTGLLGARACGGDDQGVAVLARADADSSVHQLRDWAEQHLRRRVRLAGGTSPGALPFGYVRLRGY